MMGLEKRTTFQNDDDDDDPFEYEYEYGGLLEDLVFDEILPRLPVGSLIRFKRVSKKWLAFISNDKRLVSTNVLHNSTKLSLSIVVSYFFDRYRIYILDHNGKVPDPVLVTDVSMYLNKFTGSSRRATRCSVVGSCNGLVCVALMLHSAYPQPRSMFQAVVLWNPETAQGRDLLIPPLPPSFYYHRSGADHPAFGFGFDKHTDDYKVVRILPTPPDLLSFDVFSRNAGRWRKLDKDLFGYTVCRGSAHSVQLNGCLYWLVLALGEGSAKLGCVLSFDLRDDEFRIVTVFQDDIIPEDHTVRLVKWKQNCLAVFYRVVDQDARGHDFAFRLVLDGNSNVIVGQDGERRITTLRNPDCYSWEFCGVSRERVFVAEFDPRLSVHTGKLVTYNDPFNLDHKEVGGQNIPGIWGLTRYLEAHDYVPSLVSVYPDQKTMIEEKKKMELRYWVDMLWTTLTVD